MYLSVCKRKLSRSGRYRLFSLLYKKSLGGQSMWGGMAVVIRGLDSVFLLLHEEHVHLLSPDFPTSCLQDDCCISRLASEFPAGKQRQKQDRVQLVCSPFFLELENKVSLKPYSEDFCSFLLARAVSCGYYH